MQVSCKSRFVWGTSPTTRRTGQKRNSIIREYVLPNFAQNKSGHPRFPSDIIADDDQLLVMGIERFVVPELLFRPDDIGTAKTKDLGPFDPHRTHPYQGLEQAGLPETIANCISLLPADIQGMFWGNIGLIGGSTKFPGFRERLYASSPPSPLTDADLEATTRLEELRILAPSGWEVVVYEADECVIDPRVI